MDIKEKHMLEHYKRLIENSEFDEYDIYAFLILIRNHIPNGKYQIFKEYADAVAHRRKNKGIMLNNIKSCIKNNYETINGTNVKDYCGFSIESWNKQLTYLMNNFNITINELIIKELTLCIFSIFQELIFVDDSNNKIGKLVMLVNPDCNQIYLCTSEGTSSSPMVCFAKLDNIKITQDFFDVINNMPSEAVRENGTLKLKNCKGTICEVNRE